MALGAPRHSYAFARARGHGPRKFIAGSACSTPCSLRETFVTEVYPAKGGAVDAGCGCSVCTRS